MLGVMCPEVPSTNPTSQYVMHVKGGHCWMMGDLVYHVFPVALVKPCVSICMLIL